VAGRKCATARDRSVKWTFNAPREGIDPAASGPRARAAHRLVVGWVGGPTSVVGQSTMIIHATSSSDTEVGK
jgi:hypothetical protein